MRRIFIILALFALVATTFIVADSYFRVGRRLDNLFRRDEYASIYPGAPSRHIQISIKSESESEAFETALKTFAKQSNIPQCRQKTYRAYSGPSRPTFKGDHVAIWSSISWTTDEALKTGSIYLASYDEKYPLDDFNHLADSCVQTMRETFPNMVVVPSIPSANK